MDASTVCLTRAMLEQRRQPTATWLVSPELELNAGDRLDLGDGSVVEIFEV